MSKKYLTGSAGTGKKITTNFTDFCYRYNYQDGDLYNFSWTFNDQYGYMNISIEDHSIQKRSIMHTNAESPHRFPRPLSPYNDPSLMSVMKYIMDKLL